MMQDRTNSDGVMSQAKAIAESLFFWSSSIMMHSFWSFFGAIAPSIAYPLSNAPIRGRVVMPPSTAPDSAGTGFFLFANLFFEA